LRQWWTHRYNRPTTSREWGDSYLDDLMVEFLEDLYNTDDESAAKARLKYMGTEVGPTGDPLLDFWERQIARGEDPDLDMCEDPRSAQRDALMKERARKHFAETGERIYRSRPQDQIYGREDPGDDLDLDFTDEADEALEGAVSGQIPIDTFDAFVNAAGAIKKG